MVLDDIGLCARALVKVGAHPISSLTDGSTEAEIASLLYAPIRDAVLSSYPWSFATAQAQLTRLSSTPEADYSYEFSLPADFLRAISAGAGSSSGRGAHYRLAGSVLQANDPEITLTYIFRPAEANFPAYFQSVLMARLAAEFCLPLTENSSRAEILADLADKEFARARNIDSQQDSPNRIESFPLIDVRG